MSNSGEALRIIRRIVGRAEIDLDDVPQIAEDLREEGKFLPAAEIEYAVYVADSWNWGVSPVDFDQWLRTT